MTLPHQDIGDSLRGLGGDTFIGVRHATLCALRGAVADEGEPDAGAQLTAPATVQQHPVVALRTLRSASNDSGRAR